MALNSQLRIVVREFNAKKDCREVEEVERSCEVGPSGTLSLFTDLLGDPICRVRHSPAYLMLVIWNLNSSNLFYSQFLVCWLCTVPGGRDSCGRRKKGNSRDDTRVYQKRYVWKKTVEEQSRLSQVTSPPSFHQTCLYFRPSCLSASPVNFLLFILIIKKKFD